MKKWVSHIALFLALFWLHNAEAQEGTFNFHKLGLQEGLHDGTIRCIGEDKFGYMWFGSVGALNRFDGNRVTHFTNIPGDTTSAYGSQPRSIHTDPKGRLWIGFESGLAEFDFAARAFRRISALKNFFITGIASYGDSILYLATQKGLVRYEVKAGKALMYSTSSQPQHAALSANGVNDLVLRHDSLFMATFKGLVVMDLRTQHATAVPVPLLSNEPVYTIAMDAGNNLWLGTHRFVKLVRVSPGFGQTEIYDKYLTANFNTQPLNVMDILVDKNQRIWVATAVDGLLEYKPENNSFVQHLYKSELPSSPSANHYRCLYQSKNGILWLGCDFAGINFLDPDRNLFTTMMPFADRLGERARSVARAVAEDKQGNIWMGTHDGVSCFQKSTGKYRVWRNEEDKQRKIYSNVVRAMYCDEESNTWIGTANGVNRYVAKTGAMEFISTSILPVTFYNSINEDRSGNIWFCTNDTSSLYWYSPADKQFHNIAQHPQLRKYKGFAAASYVYEDSKHRLWISFARKGVVMLDQRTGKTHQYQASDSASAGIIGNQVIDIKEDRNGVIWITSLNGITGIDVERQSFLSFNNSNGLPGNWAAPLAVDARNRVWVGVNGGLMMLHADRRQFTRFSMEDGLPSIGFPEHAGIQAANGDFIFPSYKGFIRFNPLAFQESEQQFPFYAESYTLGNSDHNLIHQSATDVLQLRPSENAISFNLVALNYLNPHQTWLAYRLKGFENEWHLTQDPKAVYTNLPGGNFTFEYKAAAQNGGWEHIAAKQVRVSLQSVFYKTTWFKTLAALLLLGMFFALYRYRTRQQQQMFQLHSKAQLLEKEKAMVMYESLKQQLNPHFLFNSLTSLRSLIKTDSNTAAWFLDGLSKVYRYVLKSADQELVLLQDEVAFVKTFAALQKVRFGEGLQIVINVDAAAGQQHIAPVVLQNLMENAIKHNTTSIESPLVIEIFSEENRLLVRNNLQRYRVVETSNKQGLQSLNTLYSFYTDQAVLITEDDKYFTVSIPLL